VAISGNQWQLVAISEIAPAQSLPRGAMLVHAAHRPS